MPKQYVLSEIFYSLQGEGMHAGQAAVFVRFAGCNLKCTKDAAGFDCDTDFRERTRMTAEKIAARVFELMPTRCMVIFTGVEPALQLDDELIEAFRGPRGRLTYLAIETNGTVPILHDLDWTTVSPKTSLSSLKVKSCDELKVVIGAKGGLPLGWEDYDALHMLVSPRFIDNRIDPEALSNCLRLIKEYPQWQLTVQLHKMLGLQ